MDIQKDEAFELAFSKTDFYKGMVESLKNKDCPFESVFEIRNGKYRSSYVQLSHEIWQAAQAVPEENALLSATLDAVQKLGSGEFVLVEREKLAMIFETATNALVYHAAPPKHDALSIIQGIARKAMVKSQEQKL